MRRLGTSTELVGLSFGSAAAPDLPLAAWQRLACHTLAVNPGRGLTGELRLDEGRFLATLEGRADVLLPLAARILADPRHAAIRVDAFGAIAERRFADWRTAGFGLEEAGALRFALSPAGAGAAARPLGARRGPAA
jgi:hypothetical protein